MRFFILAILLALLPLDALAGGRAINILYTGAIKGELEPCGCSPKSSSGGLARLSAYISANRDALEPFILIDAGNSMGEDTPQGSLKSGVVLDSFGLIGYDAAAFFGADLKLLDGGLATVVESKALPAISPSAAYPASIQIERASTPINISTDAKAHKDGFVNILISDAPAAEAAITAAWDVVLLSSGEKIEEPDSSGAPVVVSGYPKGERLGVLTLTLADDGNVAGVSHRWQTLGKDVPEDGRVRSLIDDYDAKVAALLSDEEREPPLDKTYFGAESCVDCHSPFVEKWRTTRHAGAFATLEGVGKARDPECVRCHTTGYGEEGGYYSPTATPELANVQCEQCHGPGREHLSDYTVPMAAIEEAVCLRCHTGYKSPGFDYETYKEKIKHW